jgi:hypothetical protein
MSGKRWILIAGIVAFIVIGMGGNAIAGSHMTVTANPPSAPAGSTVTLSGSGWLPGEVIEIFFGGDLQSVTADGSGDFSTPWTVPGIPVGSHPLAFTGDMGSMFNTSFEVTNPPTTTTTTTTTTAPTTTTTTTTAPAPTTTTTTTLATTTTQATTTTTVPTTTAAPTTTGSPTTTLAPTAEGSGVSPVLWVLLGALLAAVLIAGSFMTGRSTRRDD